MNNNFNELIKAIENYSSIDIIKSLVTPELLTQQNIIGRNPLMVALLCGRSSEIIKLLINETAVNQIERWNGWNPLLTAFRSGYSTEIVELLINETTVNHIDYDVRNPLIYAIMDGYPLEIIKLLVNETTVGQVDYRGQTPLTLAAGHNSPPEVLELLIIQEITPKEDYNARTDNFIDLIKWKYHPEVVEMIGKELKNEKITKRKKIRGPEPIPTPPKKMSNGMN
jgi:ankyrin repeat protein